MIRKTKFSCSPFPVANMSRKSCVNSSSKFCCMCGEYVIVKKRREITDYVRELFELYFGMSLRNTDKYWVPNRICSGCRSGLCRWAKTGKYYSLSQPMIWREPRNHMNDCYFCATKIHGYNGKYLAKVEYEYVSSVTKPLTDGPYYAVQPQEPNDPPETPDYMPTKTKTEKSVDNRLSQEELNDLIRDLDLPKCSAEILGSRLAEKNFLQESTSTSCYRNREIEFRPFFIQEADLLYCTDVSGLMEIYGIVYNAKEWRLFIDSSKVSLKVVLLHNGNKHASIPIGHSSTLKETYDNMDIVLKKINYSAHKWLICGDLKIISILLGQQGGFTLNPCYLCQWNSRERASHWTKVYEKRMLCTSQRNVKHKALVDPQDVIIPPLHIKLGIMKQFTKALPYDGHTYKFIRKTFPKLSDAKIKEGIFTGPDIRKLTKMQILNVL